MYNALPMEYQQQIETALRKKKLAEILQQRGLNAQGPQQIGPVAAKQSKFSAVANMLSGISGGYLGAQADEDVNKVRGQYAQDEQNDVAALTGMSEPDAIKAGTNSKFSRSRELAKVMQAQGEKRRDKKADVYSTNGQLPQALDVLDGRTPGALTEPKQPEVKWITSPDGKIIPQVTNYDIRGQGKVNLGAQGSSQMVNNILPTKEGEMALDQIGGTLKERRLKATTAKQVYGSVNYAIDALESGAKAGGGEPTKQVLRKAAQAIGVNLPETAGTDQLQQALLKGVIDNAAALRPASDTDLIILQKMAGDVGTDPQALVKTLAQAQAMSMKDLQDYNSYASENQKNLDPKIQSLFAGATSGYELPKSFSGPQGYQMEIMRNMQRQGMDITKFLDPDGKPFAQNSKFTIDPKAGFPGIDTNKPAPTVDVPLTSEELKRYEALKKKYGR